MIQPSLFDEPEHLGSYVHSDKMVPIQTPDNQSFSSKVIEASQKDLPTFDGDTMNEMRDHMPKLKSQYEQVFEIAKDGKWRTPDQWEKCFGHKWRWQSINARLRDAKKPKFGGHILNRRYLGAGLFEYQLLIKG